MRMTRFADVVLPLAVDRYFTYSIPDELRDGLAEGSRVVVPFGRSKYYTAIVVRTHDTAPTEYEVKPIHSLLDASPILRPPQLKLWEWIAHYYMCSTGEVYKAAVPSGLKIESETLVRAVDDYEEQPDNRLRERELTLLTLLGTQEKMSIAELERESKLRGILPTVKALMDKGAVCIAEELKHTYKAKTESCVRILIARDDQARLQSLFDELARSKKQLALLMKLMDLSRFLQQPVPNEVTRKELLEKAGVTPGVLTSLAERGIVEVYRREVARVADEPVAVRPPHPLNPHQTRAFEEIHTAFAEKDVVLLHGVTSSGKTEVYIHLIAEALAAGRQVLFMVPEIALTAQLTTRFRDVFGSKLAIYHSKFSDAERVEIWNKMLLTAEPRVVIGVRSSVFLPFHNLGLVIVDEEHEATYKQQDPAPRYHGRNVALVLAAMHGAKTLLGTATPSIETYHNALAGKYGLVELTERHEAVALPRIVAVDLKELRRRKEMIGIFSPQLTKQMHETLAAGRQAILFQNRRGFAPMVECELCAWVPRCKYCDVSLTYHKGLRQLTCHYCGYTIPLPALCPACGHPSIQTRGFGTEKIEEDIANVFPEARVARMDLDTTRSKRAYDTIIANFQQQKSNVLVGTQMITKGLDFDRVSLVGILNADMMMNYPDFRAHERAFQIMSQVAGRAGRRDTQGEVIVQTSEPEHPLIKQVIAHDYVGMYRTQLAEREQFCYPPFYRLIYIYMKHRDAQVLDAQAQRYAARLRQLFGARVLGPDNPPVARVQSLFIRKIVLKVELSASVARAKELLLATRAEMMADERFKQLVFYYDVDPI
jgi:primosomal protein N' (replication factor Y)